MIIWLASYPRSGNTLLRTILQQCMGYTSCDDQIENIQASEMFTGLEDTIGHYSRQKEWENFYTQASSVNTPVFVKTHLPPRDSQPAIYVVRDGRLAILSYLKYHRNFLPENNATIQQLILGLDAYMSWSESIEAWSPLERQYTLLLRYEELINADRNLLKKIAKFVGYDGTINEWLNPFSTLQKKKPNFFREGNINWKGDPEWTEMINQMFFYCHGEVMNKLGYILASEVSNITEKINPEIKELITLVSNTEKGKRRYQKECELRLSVINKLQTICEERLDLINRLDIDLKACLKNNNS